MIMSEEHDALLQQVPSHVWPRHKTDVGLVKSAEPLQFQLKPGAKLPNQRQYPLKHKALIGICPTIAGLLEAGVLVKTQSACNTPICPIQKMNTDDYRLVHDIRTVNAIVAEEIPVVPDPHTLLTFLLIQNGNR